MTPDAAGAIAALLTQIWRLFNSFYIPGTYITPGMLLIFPMFVGLVLKIVHAIVSQGNFAGSNGDNIKKNEEDN